MNLQQTEVERGGGISSEKKRIRIRFNSVLLFRQNNEVLRGKLRQQSRFSPPAKGIHSHIKSFNDQPITNSGNLL